MPEVRKIFEPIRIADTEIKNRIVMSPMGLGFCEDDGTITDRLIDFYEERARGGVGLIYVVCCYNDFGMTMPRSPALEDDRFLPGLRRLTDSLHKYGAKVFAQMMHMGASAFSFMLGHQPVSASSVRSGLTQEVPRELTIPEIKKTIENLADGAYRSKEGGFDGVELIGTGGYLINQFLAPLTNKRTDEYGGNLEGRMRFPIELIHRVRESVGDGFPISYRTCGDDFMDGGNGQEEIKLIVQAIEEEGADVINVAVGWHQCRVPLITMGVPRGAYVYLAQGIKEVVDIPVIACHRINDPILAEEILLDNRADMIGMGRPLLADPELPNKAAEGRFEEIRTCVACNFCFDRIFFGQEITCTFNPAIGKEREYDLIPAEESKKVIVVGGGPSGLEAARVLAMRGHRVTLYERSDKLGGQLALAAVPPEREEFVHAVQFLCNEMDRLEVVLKLGKEADMEIITKEEPDAVVIATGAIQIHPDIPGIDGENVVYAHEVLEGRVEAAGRVVVIGGGATGVETALFLAKKASINPDIAVFLALRGAMGVESAIQLTHKHKDITILEMKDKVGVDIGRTTKWTIMQSLNLHNVEIIRLATAVRITDDGVIYMHEDKEKLALSDTVVIAMGTQSESRIYNNIKDLISEVYCIGDCIEPRTAFEAIHEAVNIAMQI